MYFCVFLAGQEGGECPKISFFRALRRPERVFEIQSRV
jgi:hypothetical protein